MASCTTHILLEVEVRGQVNKFIPGSLYNKHGDPGSPPSGGEVENLTVTLFGVDITKNLSDEVLSQLEEELAEAVDQDES